MSKDNFTLFVGDLSLFCNTTHLKQAFSKYGEITAVRIAFDEQSQKQLHFGFVEFSSYESALNALSMMNGTVLCGRILRVKWAINRNEVSEESRRSGNFKLETSSVHVNFLSYQTNKLVSEESLRQIFSAFGEVKDVIIKKSTKDNNTQRGYGFVHYGNNQEGIQSTLSAISNMFDVTIDNVNYNCSMSHICEQGFMNTGAPFVGSHSSHSSRQPSPYLSSVPSNDSYYMAPPPQYAYPEAAMSQNSYYMYPNDMQGGGGYLPPDQAMMQGYPPYQEQPLMNAQYYGVAAPQMIPYDPRIPVYSHPPPQAPPLQQQQPPHHSHQKMSASSSYPPQAPHQQSYYMQQLPPQNNFYRPDVGYQQQQQHQQLQPRPLLLSSQGRSNSEPIGPANIRESPRQVRSSHELISSPSNRRSGSVSSPSHKLRPNANL